MMLGVTGFWVICCHRWPVVVSSVVWTCFVRSSESHTWVVSSCPRHAVSVVSPMDICGQYVGGCRLVETNDELHDLNHRISWRICDMSYFLPLLTRKPKWTVVDNRQRQYLSMSGLELGASRENQANALPARPPDAVSTTHHSSNLGYHVYYLPADPLNDYFPHPRAARRPRQVCRDPSAQMNRFYQFGRAMAEWRNGVVVENGETLWVKGARGVKGFAGKEQGAAGGKTRDIDALWRDECAKVSAPPPPPPPLKGVGPNVAKGRVFGLED